MFALSEIIRALTGQQLFERDRLFSEAKIDSRHVISGSLFVAIPGENTDGHDYISEAFRRGAFAALVEKDLPEHFTCLDFRSTVKEIVLPNPLPPFPFCIQVDNTVVALQKIATLHRDLLDLKTIGITGTVGKSTTKELVAEVVSQQYHTLKNIGNLNNEIGLPLTLLKAGKGHQLAILEMGFYVSGEIKLLCDIAKPIIGLITNIGTVHAERAGSMEDIANGKAELVEALPADGVAILNYDDPYVLAMAQKTKAHVFTYGLDPRANLWADQIESYGLKGIRFCIHLNNENFFVRIPLIGRHSVHTALRACAVGKVLGMSWEQIFIGLNHGDTHLRMAVINTQEGALVIDDTYNASPESMIAALNLLEEIEGYKIGILGEMLELGQYDEIGHMKVGAKAAEVCDELIAVGEKARTLVSSAIQTGMKLQRTQWFATVPEVIEYIRKRGFTQGEVILVKGSRGLQMEQIVEVMEHKQ
ncbi:MAG: UDP-N-acetylmuramoyl-tripeptide--D-alanyl-D-alanine ligase [Chloroflexi bacterium]|nr:UDP-N-acetylmuramoyl-tripeptide--D-alanyl-D-alanine ligase [Chloroflexota bacterium]